MRVAPFGTLGSPQYKPSTIMMASGSDLRPQLHYLAGPCTQYI